MKNILITGANGFVGKHLINELLANQIKVTAICGPQPTIDNPLAGVNYARVDLTDQSAVHAIDLHNIEGIVHLAGLAAVGPSFEKPMDYITTNIGIEVNLFEAALAQKTTPRFLIISSGSLYDNMATLPLTEQSAVIPSSPYAVSKLGQESMALYYLRRGFECILARPFNHAGPGQAPGFLIPDITQQVIAVEQGISDKVYVGNLDAKRDYTDVRDIARAYRLLLEKGKPGEIYNVCSGTALSGHDILASVLKYTDSNPVVEQDPAKMRPADNPIVYGDYRKLAEHTGWKPEIDIETTLADAVKDWRNRS